MKKGNRIFIITLCVFLITVSMLFLFATIYVTAFSRENVDVENDERLFSLAHGSTLTEYYVDDDSFFSSVSDYEPVLKERISLGGNKKLWVSLSDVDKSLIDGFIAAEDRKFYSHSGFDIKRTLYALSNTVFHFKKTFGASTITQQVVKNISGDNEITLKRKLAEIIRAYNIEKNHTKDEILELYINIVPMGENLYGVASAAEAYFGKAPWELSAAESATLVGITNAPTRYNPHVNYEECLKKRNDVLYAMLDFGVLDESDYRAALDEELSVLPIKTTEKSEKSWFVETVNRDVTEALMNKYGLTESGAEALLYNGGLKIYTTENTEVQDKLEAYFENKANFPKQVNDGLDFSMVICDSSTGNLLGIVGAVGEKRADRILNLAESPITPGSSLKPLALYAPLISSGRINWATVFDDVPSEFKKNGDVYVPYPQNYPKRYDGLTTVKDALRLSKNTVAIRLYNMLGAENIYGSLKRDFGFDTLVRKYYNEKGNTFTDLAPAPLALGQLTYGVSLRKLTEAYTVFPSYGKFYGGRSFIAVYDAKGNLLIENSPKAKDVYSSDSAKIMNKLLSNVTESGTASKITLKNSIDTAGKTGTSGDDKDRLFIGYTPYYTAGIWCGYRDSDKAINNLSVSHIKIWDDVMTDIHSEILNGGKSSVRKFRTDGLVVKEYCKDSGRMFSECCEKDPRGNRSEIGYFIKGNEPRGTCNRHVVCLYDTLTEGMATEYCPEECIEEISLLRITDRHFPREIIISDADYVYKETDGTLPMADSYELPYFYNYIPEDDYVGRGRNKKQFNSSCYIHSGE